MIRPALLVVLALGCAGNGGMGVDAGRDDGARDAGRDGGARDAAEPQDSGGPTDAGGRDASLEVDAGPAGVSCDERALLGQGELSSWLRKTTGPNSCVWPNSPSSTVLATADCRFFDQVWPRPWPGSGNTRNLTVFGNEGRQFIAMEFDSGNIPPGQEGRMTQEVPQFASANAGFKLWSISKCPGDYNAELIDEEMGPGCIRREMFGFTESFRWGGPDFVDDPTRCALMPNTRYYLNLVWTSDLPGTAPADITPTETCQTQRCGMNAIPSGLYVP